MKQLKRLSLLVVLTGLAFMSCIDEDCCCDEGLNGSSLSLHVTTDPSITSFNLWEEGNFSNPYAYTTSDGQWACNPGMPNISELSAQTKYYARHTPAETDPLTGHQDILIAGPYTLSGVTLGIQFERLMSQLEIVLLPGRDFKGSVENATIAFDLINDYTLCEANTCTLGGEIQTLVFDANYAYLVLPQAIRERTITVTLADGEIYTGTIDNLTLNNGRKTQLAITLRDVDNPVEITIGEAAWGEIIYAAGEAGKEIIIPAHDCEKLPGSGTLVLTCTSDGVTRQSTYYWDGEKLVCLDEPLYWGDFTEDAEHHFDFTYIPDGTGAPEQDILTGQSDGTDWGDDVNFPGLSHTNSRLTIILKQGTGWSSATEFENLTKIANLRLGGLSDNPYSYPYLTDGEVNWVIVKPQEITSSAFAELTLGNEVYTLKLRNLLSDNTLLGGLQYVITATVNKAEIGEQRHSISLSIGEIADWGDIINGTGVFN